MFASASALERDSYRCLVTGKYDALAAKRGVPLSEIQKFGSAVNTECAHIVPASTYFNLGASDPDKASKRDYAASVLAVLQRFGYNVDQLNGEKVHSLFNVMTLAHDAHDLFDQWLNLWLEATDTPNCYRVRVSKAIFEDPGRELVTFTTSDPELLPLPSAELLALHATCANVAHLSGASEYLNKFERDVESVKVMAFDGSSFETLNYALAGVAEAAVDVGASPFSSVVV
ncbi:hypothetical protein PLICRDRAFT_672317 [Plicaturopsis crispa FD-325 SS-3]|nr:hypothetical protein PLICRDRAFT_672317 [Plicaturopsis crispa FD-325 SS-3]